MKPGRRRQYERQLKLAREESLLVVAATTAVTGRRRAARAVPHEWRERERVEEAIDALIAEQENETLAAIDRALTVLREAPDAFGRCAECGQEIPTGELDVVPWLSRCAEHGPGTF